MQIKQRTYWEESWENFARAGHCVTHLLSGHLGLVSTTNTSLPPITSFETAKLGIPHPAVRQEPNYSLVGKWTNSSLSHFLQSHCLTPLLNIWGGFWPPSWIWKFLLQRVESRSQAQTMHRNTESPLYICLLADRWFWCPAPFFQM